MKNQRIRKTSVSTKVRMLSVYTSTITAWLQTKPLKPRISPAERPTARHSHRRWRSLNSRNFSMPSSMSSEPRDTIMAMIPHASAAANAELTVTRHAMLENGSSFVNAHEYSVHTG